MDLQFHSVSDDSSSTSSDESKKDLETEFELFQVKKLSDFDTEIWMNVLKRFTTFFVVKSQQTEEIDNIIKTFVTNDEAKLLILYTNENKHLKAGLNITSVSFEQLLYFIKISPFDKYKTEINLNGFVHFGVINQLYEESLILLLNTIYFPALYNLNIAHNSKIRLIESTLTCMRGCDEIKHIEFGLNSLFLPNILTGNCGELENFRNVDQNVLKQIEDLVISWCRQIEIAINDTEISYTMMNITTPLTELRAWKYKYDHLKYLSFQLSDPYMMKLYKLMDGTNCAFIDRLNLQKDNLQEAMNVALNNIRYLQILEQPCEDLNNVNNPDDIIELLPPIFLRISIICNTSKQFRTWSKSEFLVRSFSNQIIQVCSNLINIQGAVRGNTACYLPIISSTIRVCSAYKNIFKLVGMYHNNLKSNAIRWNINNLFDNVSVFEKHCEDLKYICNLTNIFKVLDQNEPVTFPTCANPKLNLKKRLQEITESFQMSLKEFDHIENLFSSTQNKVWFKANERHSGQMGIIQDHIRVITEDTFRSATDVEERIDLLCALHKYSDLSSVRGIYEKNVTKTCQLYLQQLREVDNAYATNQSSILKLFSVKRRLQRIYQILTNNSGWLSIRSSLYIVNNNFTITIGAIDKYIIYNYMRWQTTVRAMSINKLRRPLIVKSASSLGLYEINIDRAVLKMHDDVKLWNQLGFITPFELDPLMKLMPRVIALHRKVEILLIHYNRLITGLTIEEFALFYDTIKLCRHTMNPALTTIYWDSNIASDRTNQYFNQVLKIENIINLYKENNVKIINTCQLIQSLNFVPVFKTKNYGLNEFENTIDIVRMKISHSLINFYNYICRLLMNLYNQLAPYIQKRKPIWLSYIEKVDSLFEFSLKISSKRSLKKFNDLLTTSEDDDDEYRLKILIFMNLENDRVKFICSLSELASVINSFFLRILEVFKLLPRIYNIFKPDTMVNKPSYVSYIANEVEQLNQQHKIDTNMQQIITDLLTRIKQQWQEFKHVWEIKETVFVDRYRRAEFSVKSLDQDLSAYYRIKRYVSKMNGYTFTGFVYIDASQFICEFLNRCEIRILTLIKLLEDMLKNTISSLTNFVVERIESLKNCPLEKLAALTRILHNEIMQKRINVQLVEECMEITRIRNIIISQEIITSNTKLEHLRETMKILMERCKLKVIYKKSNV